MKQVAIRAARLRLSALLADVARGEKIVIARRGIPVAHLVAATPDARPMATRNLPTNTDRKRVAQVFEELARLRYGVSLDMPLRQAIELGRD